MFFAFLTWECGPDDKRLTREVGTQYQLDRYVIDVLYDVGIYT
jgi:hypothetical protein